MKLPVLSGLEVAKILSKTGFRQLGQRGSHVLMLKKQGRKHIKTVIPMHKEIATGTLLSI
jgi:predicted RNA binding protein YcfA (HicA-like mRNA interferase family)